MQSFNTRIFKKFRVPIQNQGLRHLNNQRYLNGVNQRPIGELQGWDYVWKVDVKIKNAKLTIMVIINLGAPVIFKLGIVKQLLKTYLKKII